MRVTVILSNLTDDLSEYPSLVQTSLECSQDITANEVADRLVEACKAAMLMATYHPANVEAAFHGYGEDR
jgi:hypothetical protein